ITSDKESYEPGEPVSGVVRVTSGGAPVRAEVAVSVADEGVLQLIAYKTPDPLAAFYASWGLGVDAATNWNRIARLNDPSSGDPDMGGDAGGGPDDSVRSNFVSSAFWAPSLVTDASGEVRFTFKAPDNLTAFRMMAVAADIGSRFGSGEQRFTVKKPLLAKPILPRFVNSGDRARVGVVVHNYTGAAGTATVTATAKGAYVHKGSREVELAADGSARVAFSIKAGKRKNATFEFAVAMGEHRDALRLDVPVNRPLTIDKKLVAAGVAGRDGKETITIPVSWDDTVVASRSRLSISVDRTGLAELEPGLRYLIEYPYGCLEQTLSRLIPMTKVEDLATSLDIKELKGPKLAGFIRAGVAKVAKHQHSNGHFSLWPSGTTYPHLTVYALHGLAEARRAEIRVPEDT
ncbi:MAG: alpha-2-macroglobulin family protein, partial [Myxococcota bacterium]